MIPILILAGGASRRMRGRDKLLEEVEGRPVLRRLVSAGLATGAPVLVGLRPGFPARRAILQDLPATLIDIDDAAEGMGATLRNAVKALPDGADGVLVLPGDLPEIGTEDLQMVLAARAAQSDALVWRATSADGQPGHPILFDKALLPDFDALRGETGARSIVARAAAVGKLHLVPLPDQRAVRDLDTPEDWAAWRQSRADAQNTP